MRKGILYINIYIYILARKIEPVTKGKIKGKVKQKVKGKETNAKEKRHCIFRLEIERMACLFLLLSLKVYNKKFMYLFLIRTFFLFLLVIF